MMLSYICFAKWFGVVSLLLSLGVLFNLDDAKEMARHMTRQDSGYIMGGVLPIIFGALILSCNARFEFTWALAVTLAGIASLLCGASRVLFVSQWKHILQKHVDKIPPLFALFGLMFGLLLCYAGYIAPLVEVPSAIAAKQPSAVINQLPATDDTEEQE